LYLQFGIFDLLKESGELLSSGTVVECLNTSFIGMQTLLGACVGLKVLKVEWKDGKNLYGNTEFDNLFLAKSSPKSKESFFRYMDEAWSLHGKEVISAFDLSGFQLIFDHF
ncbi:hypothetical protein Chor_000691, partial [Crotalus horridus]